MTKQNKKLERLKKTIEADVPDTSEVRQRNLAKIKDDFPRY